MAAFFYQSLLSAATERKRDEKADTEQRRTKIRGTRAPLSCRYGMCAPDASNWGGDWEISNAGGKNWILPKEINENRFFWDSHWLKIWKKSLVSLYETEWRERGYGLCSLVAIQSPYFKYLWGPGIDSKEWIPPAYVAELVFLNVYGAPELIPRNEFRQPM